MPLDLAALVRRDHDDIGYGLDLIVDPATSSARILDAIDGVRLGFRVHAIAEERVFRVLRRLQPMPLIADASAQATRDHIDQEVALDRFLHGYEPGTPRWYEWVLEVRETMTRHAFAADMMAAQLRDAVPSRLFDQLASRYATDRLRVLADTRPLAFSEAC
jgi:hypothetical protein